MLRNVKQGLERLLVVGFCEYSCEPSDSTIGKEFLVYLNVLLGFSTRTAASWN
jgi:hypothetical protein